MASVLQQAAEQMGTQMQASTQQSMSRLGSVIENALSVDAEAFASAILMNMDEDDMTQLISSMMSGEDASYANNLSSFGYADRDDPSEISIYPRISKARNR